jgi:hypothetical protein
MNNSSLVSIITKLLICFLLTFCCSQHIYAKKTAFGKIKSHQKKMAYEGFGKPSKANGRIKTKTTRGYFKPSNGYKFVNPYSRSK